MVRKFLASSNVKFDFSFNKGLRMGLIVQLKPLYMGEMGYENH